MSPPSETATRTSEFLARVLPSEGLKVVAIKGEFGVHHVFCRTIEEMVYAIGRANAAGHDAYHACAGFTDPGPNDWIDNPKKPGKQIRRWDSDARVQSRAVGAQAFWVDIDAGPGKPYDDVVDAWDAAGAFIRQYRLPHPLMVVSGLGLHLYWPLDRMLAPPEWVAGAKRLRNLMEIGGLKADPARTADIASILRPPGSLNFKYNPPRTVRTDDGPLPGPYPTDAFLALLGPVLAPEMQAHADRLAQAARAQPSGPAQPTYGGLIVDHCAQLRALRDTGGRLPEPEWYAALCLLAHCDDGEELAHRWSSGDERYSEEGTQAKLEQARRASGPTTCAGFAARNATRCIGCANQGKITSPIVLGRSASVLPPLPALPTGTPENVIAGVTVPPCPWPFRRGMGQSIGIDIEKDDGTKRTLVIYEHAAFVSSVRQGESDRDVSIVLRHHLPHEGWLEAIIPWQDHSPNAVLNVIGNQLVIVNSEGRKWMMDYIYRAAKALLNEKKTDLEYAQFGWKSDMSGFLWGKNYYPLDAEKPVEVGVSAEVIDRAQMMGKKGSYEEWRTAANRMFAGPHQGLLLLASFAAPLMRFRTSAGGAIISAVSQQSGRGKTTALTAAKSVWGSKQALDMNRIDTNNSRFRALAVLGNLPVIFDELRNRDLEVVKDFVLSFTDGRDKNRLTQEGKLRALHGGWSTLLLSAANVSLAQAVSYDGENAQMARVLEYQMEMPAGLSVSDGAALERTFEQNYGHAGEDFVFNLCTTDTVKWVTENIDKSAREIEQLMPGTANRLYVSALACLQTAGTLVQNFGILEFSLDKIMEFGIKAAVGMSQQLSGMEVSPQQILAQFVNDNWTNCLAVEEAPNGRPCTVLQLPRTGLTMRYERRPNRLFIDRRVIREWCTQKRYTFGEMESALLDARVLTSVNDHRSLGTGTHYAAAGVIRCWVVNADTIQPVEDLGEALPKPGRSPVPPPPRAAIAALPSTAGGTGFRPPVRPA